MPDFLTGMEPEAESGQWRMTGIKLVNWGTYSGPHHAVISADGHVITGPSGNGKSTLTDATSALLFAPKDQDFNAAARDANQKGSDRTLFTYLRGAYAAEEDAEGKATPKLLRRKAVWGGIGLEYMNSATSKTVTLVRVLRLSETATRNDNVQSAYMIFDRPVSLVEFQDSVLEGIDVGVLRRTHTPLIATKDFNEYQQALMGLLNIRSAQAFKLMQKLQAIKGVETLDGLLSEFMLDKPKTGADADAALAQIRDTESAFRAVQSAKEQLDHLMPLRIHTAERADAQQLGGFLADQLNGLDRLQKEVTLEALGADLTTAQTALELAVAKVDASTARQEELDAENESLVREHAAAGGGDSLVLEEKIRNAQAEITRRAACRVAFDAAASTAGLTAAKTREEFDILIAEASRLKAALLANSDADNAAMFRAHDDNSNTQKALNAAKAQLKALDGNGSNVEVRHRDIRDQVAAHLGIPKTEFPFPAELMQVRDLETEWSGAIERVLASFASSMLVPTEHYAAVSKYINDRNLQRNFVYYPVDTTGGPDSDDRFTVLGKLDFAKHRMAGWVRGRVGRDYNLVCVDTIDQFERERLAVTRAGLFKSRGDRNVKNDLVPVNEERNWILGFGNAAKEALYRAEIDRLTPAAKMAADQFAEAFHAQQGRHDRNTALDAVLTETWSRIDTDATVDALHALNAEHVTFMDQNPDLKAVDARQTQNRTDRAKAKVETDALIELRGQARGDVTRLTNEITAETGSLSGLLEPAPEVADAIRARITVNLDGKSVRALSAEFGKIRRTVEDESATQRSRFDSSTNAAINIFLGYKTLFDGQASDLGQTIMWLPDHLAKLDTIEHDRLPDLLETFRARMQKGPVVHLADLLSTLRSERADIDKRIRPVNDTLRETDFNDGTYLNIRVKSLPTPDLNEFRSDVQDFIKGAALPDERTADVRFELLSSIADRLDSGDAWRRRALDVRNHVEFIAEELDADDVQVDWHTSGQSRSGGERTKLVAFALAAALKFQLTDQYDALPSFACVIIDEAFGKADGKFTVQALDALKKFGFQMVLVTPNKMIMTFQAYVAGATIVDFNKKDHTSRPITILGKRKLALVAALDEERQLTDGERAMLAGTL